MLGGLGQPEADVYDADLVHRTAQAFGAWPRLVPAPGIVTNKWVRDALLADPQISDTLALGARAFDVIRAALRGKLIHVLVTDEGIAPRLLEGT